MMAVTGASTRGRERQEKILQAIYEAADGTTRYCAYEDIVVRAWKLFPEEFGLRGYTDLYPDASDLHKPLYGPLKREGLVRSRNKKFGLTDRGLSMVERLRSPSTDGAARGRVERDQKVELDRVAQRKAVSLVLSQQADALLDTDLYDFYAVTVRTKPANFAGRIATVDAAIDAAMRLQDPSVDPMLLSAIAATRQVLHTKFESLIAARSAARENRGGK